MTTQLRLVDTPKTPQADRTETRRTSARRSSGSFSRPVLVAEPHKIRDRLDDHTRERGLIGIAQAREALRDAKKRAAIRDTQHRACLNEELEELANEAKRPDSPLNHIAPETPRQPNGHAAA